MNYRELMHRLMSLLNKASLPHSYPDNATEEANSIRYGAMQYTDDMLAKLHIIEHSLKDNKEKYDSLLSGLENVLSVVTIGMSLVALKEH